MSLGELLKTARERCSLTLTEASTATGIGTSSISEFENNKREPRMSLLGKLANAYGQPLAFFFNPAPTDEIEVVLWREEPSHLLAQDIEARFLRLCEQYRNLESWCKTSQDADLPFTTIPKGGFSYPQAQALATQVRKEFVLGDHPGPALKKVMEEVYGVKIFYIDFEPTGCAACTLSSRFGAAILLNSSNAPWRRTFDLAHELFHILTWKVFRDNADGTIALPDPIEEKYANSFASHLLLPTEALQNSINSVLSEGKIRTNDINCIAREYDVSVDALIWRLHSLYRWSNKDETRGIIDRVKQEAPRRTWDPSNYSNLPDRYIALASRALNKGLISVGKFADYLEVSRTEAENYVTQEATENDQIEVTPA